jgi:3-hydroxyisobutyrate dehydrogenase-like beta-hydroxyacid dehydrogenase
VTEAGPAPVGFIGLGNIGKPMARRLLGWAGGLQVFDLAPAPLAELEAAGATVAASVADLARMARIICVMVRDDDQVRDVLAQITAAAQPGTVVVIHSTVAPDTPAQVQEATAAHGVLVIDAPVSGGPMGAAEGTLAILAGGTAEAFALAHPVLELMGTRVVHTGPIGTGTAMKLARNLMHFVAFTAATEAQRLAEAAGLDLVELGNVVRHTDAITGGPGAVMYRDSTAPLSPDDFWYGVFDHVRTLGEKDLGFAIGLAHDLAVDVPLAELALGRLASGLGISVTDDRSVV